MAIVSVNHVNFIGGTPEELEYSASDENSVLSQLTANELRPVRVEVLVDIEGVAAPRETTAKIAYDINGYQLNDPWHIVALPCPPYCGKGKGGRLSR